MSNEKKGLALQKINFILMGISVGLIVIGFFLMSGSATTEAGFEPAIFSFQRIKLAPMVVLSGFLLMIVAIIWNPDRKKQ